MKMQISRTDTFIYQGTEVKSLSRVRLFATPWTVAYQDPQFMGFSRQDYYRELPFPSPTKELKQLAITVSKKGEKN